jgi:hypothetical protein
MFLPPEQREVVDVRTKRGVTRALLFRKALLRADGKPTRRLARRSR